MQQQGTYVYGFSHEDQHMALVGQTWGVCKAMESSLFDIKFPRHKRRESKDSFIKPYLTFQQLNNYGLPRILFTSSSLARNKIYASQSNLNYVIREHH
jgi:hypothetical protein